MAIKLLMVMIVCGPSPGLFQYAIILATRDPMVMPGHTDLRRRITRANAMPDGGQAGRAVVFSNERKYPSRAER